MLEDQSHPELQSASWETLASLTGFTREIPKASQPQSESVPKNESSENTSESKDEIARSSDSITEADNLLDPEDLDEQAQTKSQIWTHPLAKGVFAAGLVGVGVGGIGLFLWSIQGVKPSLQAKVNPSPIPPDPTPQVDPTQAEIAKLKTVNALGTQAQALKQNQAIADVKTLPTAKSKSKVPSRHTPDRSAVKTATSRSLPSAPVVPSESRYASISRSPLATVRPATTIAPAASASRIATLPREQQFDPQTAWQAALNTGSYGQTNDETRLRAAELSESDTLSDETPPTSATLVDSRTTRRTQNKSLTSDTELNSALSDSRYERDTAAILSGEQSNYSTVATGITASATLITSIVWAQDLKIDLQTQRFIIQLDHPIVSDGKIVLDQGTRLVAQVQSTSESGAVQLSIVSIVRSTPDGEQTIDIPKGSISITADDGRPLIADRQSRNRQAGVDFGTVLSGALSQAGTAINQPQSQIITTSPYTSSTVTNGGRNIVGSVLQGAFGSASQQLQQRNQSQSLQHQEFWVLPAGRRLQLTVTNAFGVEV